MNKSQRIYLNTDNTNTDKNIFVKLEQDIDTLEIMSLKIDTKEIYRDFNADFGVLIGRVNANEKVGVPNAKVSIFIPLQEEDENDGDIVSIYPYKSPRDENNDGKRYNLLPRVSTIDPQTGVRSPKQPFGSFPTREEITTNPTYLEVYKKYYKYSTITNDSGDYMIFGVPTGIQTVHMSVDITDIGPYSMTPLMMVNALGYSPNLFNTEGTRIKESNDLDDLVNIETQEISVNIIPFWGDTENFNIGITRQDFRIKAKIINNIVVFGASFTDHPSSMWAENSVDDRNFPKELYRITDKKYLGISAKKTANLTETIYYYPADISDNEIDTGSKGPEDMKILDKSEYIINQEEGNFVYLIKTNRNKYITDERGEKKYVAPDYNGGVFEDFRGFFTFEITEDDAPFDFNRRKIGESLTRNDNFYAYIFRQKFKVPQKSNTGQSFTDEENNITKTWRREDYTFKIGGIYSIAKFQPTVYHEADKFNGYQFPDDNGWGFTRDDLINVLNRSYNYNVGVIGCDNKFGIISDDDDNEDGELITNEDYEFPDNGSYNDYKVFGANWINFCLPFSHYGYSPESGEDKRSGSPDPGPPPRFGNNNLGVFAGLKSNTQFSAVPKDKFFYKDNEQLIAADNKNTRFFSRSDLHHIDFIKVEKQLLEKLLNLDKRGFNSDEVSSDIKTLIENGDFKNGETGAPYFGGRIDGDWLANPTNIDPKYYFYKGIGKINCIEFLFSLGLI